MENLVHILGIAEMPVSKAPTCLAASSIISTLYVCMCVHACV